MISDKCGIKDCYVYVNIFESSRFSNIITFIFKFFFILSTIKELIQKIFSLLNILFTLKYYLKK